MGEEESEEIMPIHSESSKIINDIENNGEKHVEKIEFAVQSKESVEDIMSSAVNNNIELDEYAKDAHREIDQLLSSSMENLINSKYNDTPNITWPTIGEFNIQKGKEKIEEYIKTWQIGENWLYWIDYLCEDIFAYSKRYRYKVQWSVPTRRKPIPRATASVYFTVNISSVKPQHFPSNVFYIFETSKLVHIPGKSRFREKWLKDIIESKVLLMETGVSLNGNYTKVCRVRSPPPS